LITPETTPHPIPTNLATPRRRRRHALYVSAIVSDDRIVLVWFGE